MRLTIHDLERESGLARRTIHYYTHEGLLPAPRGSGPSSTYGEEHLLRLRLIPTLKAAGLRLDRIGCALDGLSLVEMRRLVRLTPKGDLDDPVRLAEWLQRGRDGTRGEETGSGEAEASEEGATAEATDPGIHDDATRWVRRQLAPGVELHYCPSAAEDLDAKVRRLGELARRLFTEPSR